MAAFLGCVPDHVLSVLLPLWVMVPVCLSARFTLLLAMPNTSTPFSVGRIGAAALIAMDAVNNSTEILPGRLSEPWLYQNMLQYWFCLEIRLLSGVRVNWLRSLGHQLDFQYVDDECDDLVGPGKIVALQRERNFSAFIGPCCSDVRDA